jgi:2-haloacid dehalogenase
VAYRALVFDAYGTLYDVQSVHGAVAEACGDQAGLVTQLWRLKQLEYSWLRGLMGDYQDFWSVTGAALDFALEAAGIAATPARRDRLMARYLALELYPEARAALAALGGYRLAILSNGSPAMLDALVKASGVAALFAAVISVDRAKSYKPDPKCYTLATAALGVAKDEVLFVSSNGFDVAGAKHFGFDVAWIDRGAGAPANASADPRPAQFFALQRGRAERLGHAADYRVASLADLPSILSGEANRPI